MKTRIKKLRLEKKLSARGLSVKRFGMGVIMTESYVCIDLEINPISLKGQLPIDSRLFDKRVIKQHPVRTVI